MTKLRNVISKEEKKGKLKTNKVLREEYEKCFQLNDPSKFNRREKRDRKFNKLVLNPNLFEVSFRN